MQDLDFEMGSWGGGEDMKVCVIGVGGLGANIALALAECGYELTLVDFDVVDEKFLRRFIPFASRPRMNLMRV